MSNSAGSDMEPGSEDEGPCNVASPSPVASPDSNNNSESGQSPAGSDNEDGSGQESGQEDNNDEVARDSGSEGQGDGAGSGSDNEKNSDAEVQSSPSSPAPENDSATGDRSAGEEENGEDGRESRQSSTSGASREQGIAEQVQSDNGQQQDDDEAPSCHDSPPASPSPSNTAAEERSSAPSSPVRRNSDDEKDSDREDANEAGSDKEEDEDDKEDSDRDEDKDDSDNESKVGELIANIFGDSDDESEFEGFGKEDLDSTKKKKDKAKKARKVLSDSEEEDDHEDKEEEKVAGSDEDEEKDMELSVEPEDHGADETEQPAPVAVSQAVPDVSSSDDELEPDSRRSRNSDFMSDFDIMMAKKKEENSKRRKRKDVDIISDTDDIIVEIIKEMKAAAEEDKELNQAKRAATKKLKLLPVVVPQLKKLDLKGAFLDQGVLHAMAEWLAPLPDKSLPHLQIREHMLRLLAEFPPLDQGFLKSSGIGRAVMYLYKHPKESKENRERAGRLINEWARPIFNLNTNYSSISKEEREQKDFERMPQKRKIRLDHSTEEEPPSKKDIDKALTGEDKSLRPGEKGWVARARVPMPSTKDYVVRPKWNCDTEFVKNTKKTVTRLDKHMRMIQERKKKSKAQRAVTISIEGRHMSL
ncbi:uncharacterized protein LOC142571726 isoform X2 [Dermacentor variabilis]|uniref:uncharacterized protein LOC142571726 isoform X2 n=1 Tax=Dermacentor variabilis TaxID=34621 RepID=UPI003F5C67A6